MGRFATKESLETNLFNAQQETSKVDAVKTALRREIASSKGSLPIRERLAKSLAMARDAGPFAPGDHKRENDEMWAKTDALR